MKTEYDLRGIPDNPPEASTELAEDENLFTGEASAADRELDAALAEAAGGLRWLAPLRRGLGSGPVLVMLICLVLLVLFSQALTVIQQLAALPLWSRYAGYGLLLGLGGGVVWALWRLVRVFSRLRVTPRLPVETLRELANRAELRQQANARLHQARTTLNGFLASYPLHDDSAAMTMLARCSMTPEALTDFKNTAKALADIEHGTPEGWIERFDRQFLGVIDTAARRRINNYALRVALKTAALPAGFDTAVILLNAYLLARDMCTLYNLRTTGAGTVAVLARVMFNAFAAGQMQDLTATTADLFFEGGGAVFGVGRAVAARAAEGSVNALLFLRLGSAMVRHLRPVWPPKHS